MRDLEGPFLHRSKGVLEKEAEIEEGEEREGRHGEWLRRVEEKLDVKSSINDNESLCCLQLQLHLSVEPKITEFNKIERCLQFSRMIDSG